MKPGVVLVDGGAAQEARPSQAQVVSHASLARGKAPEPGFQGGSYFWRDVVSGPPPRRKMKGGGVHVTYHGTEEGGDVRISYTTLLRVDPGFDADSPHDDVIHVDERLSVQRRALQELIDRERAFSDRLASRWRASLGHSLVRQRRAANHLKAAWAIATAVWVIKAQARVGYAVINGTRSFLRSLVHVPDVILTRSQSASMHLSTRSGRRVIRSGLRDPAGLSNNEKGVVLLLVGGAIVASLLLSNTLFALFLPQWAFEYQRFVRDFSASLLSVLALPIPQEPLLVLSTLAVGAVLAFSGLFVGKIVGSWILYLIGDSLYETIERQTEGKPRMRKVVDWMHRNADRSGFWLLTVINGIPLMPDLLVYAFAMSGMSFRRYIGGIALGTTLKFVAIIVAVNLLGPELVQRFLEHPIQTLRGGP